MALGTSAVLPSVYLIDGQFVANDAPSQPPFLTESASSQWLNALSRFADALTAL